MKTVDLAAMRFGNVGKFGVQSSMGHSKVVVSSKSNLRICIWKDLKFDLNCEIESHLLEVAIHISLQGSPTLSIVR